MPDSEAPKCETDFSAMVTLPEKANFSGKVRKDGRRLPATLQNSFAEILAKKNLQQQRKQQQQSGIYRQQNQQVSFALKGSKECEGFPFVKFKREEWWKLAECDEGYTLIGKFVKRRSIIDVVRKNFQRLFPISGAAHIGAFDAFHIVIQFSEKDCARVLLKGQASVEGILVSFGRWTPDWRQRNASPVVPVWIRFQDLPFHLFNPCCLSHVFSTIGNLIGLDAPKVRRTRPSVARAKVEIDLRKKLVEKIQMEICNEGGEVSGFLQRIVYESVPAFCTVCEKFGHVSAMCGRGERKGTDEGEVAVEEVAAEVLEAAVDVVMAEVVEKVLEEEVVVAGMVESKYGGAEAATEAEAEGAVADGPGQDSGLDGPVGVGIESGPEDVGSIEGLDLAEESIEWFCLGF